MPADPGPAATSQHLRVLDGTYVVELRHATDPLVTGPEATGPEATDPEATDPGPAGWLALVRSDEGLTVVRRARTGDDAPPWAALFSGGTLHGLDVPGMLVALLRPLADGGVPVFVCSTFGADVVLVPAEQLDAAAGLLSAAGHRVDRP